MKEEADTLMRQSLASLEAARSRYEHVQELAKAGPLAGKELVAAKEALERARAAYEEVQQEFPFLPAEPYEHPLQLRAIEIHAPQQGQLVEVHVRPRQFVVQGDPLWTTADWSVLWLRVPVFEGDLFRIDRTSAAEITTSSQETPRSVAPTGIPQPTQDGRRTVDLTYEIANADGQLRPGQAVTVSLPVGGTTEEIVVPRSAVIWDGMGSAAVYIAEPANTFRRQRIQVGPALGNDIVVKDGLDRGQSVVTVGAEALYGEEFKGQIQVLDDD
jgi:RND family efflux transporter MFP subunit